MLRKWKLMITDYIFAFFQGLDYIAIFIYCEHDESNLLIQFNPFWFRQITCRKESYFLKTREFLKVQLKMIWVKMKTLFKWNLFRMNTLLYRYLKKRANENTKLEYLCTSVDFFMQDTFYMFRIYKFYIN